MTCACGQPAHPAYGVRCEDCWVGSNPSMNGPDYIIPKGRKENYRQNGRVRSKRFFLESPLPKTNHKLL